MGNRSIVGISVEGTEYFQPVQTHVDINCRWGMSALQPFEAYFTYEKRKKSPVHATMNIKPFFRRHDDERTWGTSGVPSDFSIVYYGSSSLCT